MGSLSSRDTCQVPSFPTEWLTQEPRHRVKYAVFILNGLSRLRRNGRVHSNRRECQFSRLLAAEVCASKVVMLDRPRSDIVEGCWLPTPFASFPFTSLPVRRRVPSDSVSTLLIFHVSLWPGRTRGRHDKVIGTTTDMA